MPHRTTAKSLCVALLLPLGCVEREASCAQPAAAETTEASDTGKEAPKVVTEQQWEWVEFNERNVLDGSWATRRFSLNGQVRMEDSSGATEFTLSPPELAALLELVQEPSFVQFATQPPLECSGTTHDVLFLRVSAVNGMLFEQSAFSTCLWGRRDNVNLGQVTYGVTDFLRLAHQISVNHLDCPHPQNLQDGIIEPVPQELYKLCQSVWNGLSDLESVECHEQAIAVGVKDCF